MAALSTGERGAWFSPCCDHRLEMGNTLLASRTMSRASGPKPPSPLPYEGRGELPAREGSPGGFGAVPFQVRLARRTYFVKSANRCEVRGGEDDVGGLACLSGDLDEGGGEQIQRLL